MVKIIHSMMVHDGQDGVWKNGAQQVGVYQKGM